MAKPPREVDKPGEMCSYNPKTGKYGDRWLWEEILGEDLSGPPAPSQPVGETCRHAHPTTRTIPPRTLTIS